MFTWCPGREGTPLPWMTATASCHLSKEGPPVFYPIRLHYSTYSIKGSLTRDFRRQVFFMTQFPPGLLRIPLRPFKIFTRIRGDIRNFVFIAGINDTGNKLLTGVNNTLPVSLLPAINYCVLILSYHWLEDLKFMKKSANELLMRFII